MARMLITIREKTAERFREAAMRKFGWGRGSLSRAAEEALILWLKENSTT